MSLSANSLPFSAAAADLASQCSVSVVVPPAFQDKPVSLEVSDADAERVFQDLGSGLGLTARFAGGVVSFATVGDAVRDFCIVRPGFEESERVEQALKAVLGGGVAVTRLGTRVLVAGDRGALDRAVEVADEFESGQDGWLLDVRVVQVSKSFRRDLGLDVNAAASAGASMDAHAGSLTGPSPVFGLRARVVADAVLAAADDGQDARTLRTGSLYLLEGANAASLQQGDVVPVPRRTVSDQGTVTVTGFDRIQTGFNITASAKRIPGGIRMDVKPSLSSVSGFVEGSPITSESTVSATVDVRSGDWVVLSGLEGADFSQRTSGIAKVDTHSEHWTVADSSVLVLVRATRVSSADELRRSQPVPAP